MYALAMFFYFVLINWGIMSINSILLHELLLLKKKKKKLHRRVFGCMHTYLITHKHVLPHSAMAVASACFICVVCCVVMMSWDWYAHTHTHTHFKTPAGLWRTIKPPTVCFSVHALAFLLCGLSKHLRSCSQCNFTFQA